MRESWRRALAKKTRALRTKPGASFRQFTRCSAARSGSCAAAPTQKKERRRCKQSIVEGRGCKPPPPLLLPSRTRKRSAAVSRGASVARKYNNLKKARRKTSTKTPQAVPHYFGLARSLQLTLPSDGVRSGKTTSLTALSRAMSACSTTLSGDTCAYGPCVKKRTHTKTQRM